MGNPFEDALDAVSDALKTLGEWAYVGLVIFVVLIIVASLAPIIFENKDTIQEDISQICGLRDEFNKIFEQLDSISSENFDARAIQIYWDLLGGKEISECDAWYFYQQLDENNRKKLNLQDLTCKLNDCLKQ